MRAKSSSELTSLSRRSELRCATSSCERSGRGKFARRSSASSQRSQHQRQRRAELVADVREEGGLGAVDFRQRRGAPALLFVGARIGHRGGDLRADQLEETGVQLVEPDARADADHQRAGGLVRDVGLDRHHGHGVGHVRRSADA